MLNTARQACARRLAPSFPPFPPALPAESSRQALLRASASCPHHATTPSSSTPSPSLLWNGSSSRSVHSESTRRSGTRTSVVGGAERRISSGSKTSAAYALAEEGGRYDEFHNRSRSRSYGGDDAEPGRIQHNSAIEPLHPLSAEAQNIDRRRHTRTPEFQDDLTFDSSTSTRQPAAEQLDSWLQTFDLSSLPPSPLPPLETFRGLAQSQPLLALLTLQKMPQDRFSALGHSEVRDLIYRLRKVTRETPAVLDRLDVEDVTKSLRILRAILFALPSEPKTHDHHAGAYFHTKISRHFIYLCYKLGAPRFAKFVFQERLRAQLASDTHVHPPLYVEGIARDMVANRQWRLIADIFSPANFPHRLYTPDLIAYYMQAHFGIHQASKIPRIFELYDLCNLSPTADAFNHLTQALLELGDLPSARAVVRQADESGVIDPVRQQLAILKGYTVLGRDVNLEQRVLNDIERLELPLSNRLLNALIRLRLQSNEIRGIGNLLSKFDLTHLGVEGPGDVEASQKTGILVMKLAVASGDLERLKAVWLTMKAGARIDDEMISTVVQGMARYGLLDVAAMMLGAPGPGSEALEVEDAWNLPDGVKPGLQSLNFLTGELSRRRGLRGLSQALSLYHKHEVTPDNFTLKILVDYIRYHVEHTPLELAILVNRILRHTHLKCSPAVVDGLIADAVVADSRVLSRRTSRLRRSIHTTQPRPRLVSNTSAPELVLREAESENTFSPSAGLRFTERYERVLRSMISQLEASGSRGTSESLINRLRYDAMMASTVGDLPSARVIWNAMLARGFKPNAQHVLSLMKGYSDAGHINQAKDLLFLADQVGVAVDESMLFTLLVAAGKAQRPKVVLQAYRRIKTLCIANAGSNSKAKGLNDKPSLRVVTATIQALHRCGHWFEAAHMCHTDLKDLDVRLDRQAVNVAGSALGGVGDFRSTLELFKRHGDALNPISRRIVRKIKNYQRKALGFAPYPPATGRRQIIADRDPRNRNKAMTLYGLIGRELSEEELGIRKEDEEILEMARQMLLADDKARPRSLRRTTRLSSRLRSHITNAFLGPKATRPKGKRRMKFEREFEREYRPFGAGGSNAEDKPVLSSDLSSSESTAANPTSAKVKRGRIKRSVARAISHASRARQALSSGRN
ncbi:hypothetical protein I316_07729 [Kwoniella heveanensis BCC8398]|uniref:Pentatricopeptide repeat protein n=1 Tax=Kwoniella heveanensis BCC8398 TaxID=1296120 RepID=A0A1B9GI32_9TREE|nr:hypothetical protein I316_07729 [Kwoniella heveanensis BCC8398]